MKRKVGRYPLAKSGEWIMPRMNDYRISCCDCGLIHRMDFKIVKWGRGHTVMLRVFRHNRVYG